MSDQQVRLQAVLDWVAAGRLSTADAAARIRAMQFHVKPEDGEHADVLSDIEADEPGGVADIAHAYAAGRITRQQYEQLAAAAAAAIRKQEGSGGPSRPSSAPQGARPRVGGDR